MNLKSISRIEKTDLLKKKILNLLWTEQERYASGNLSKKDIIWDTVIKTGNLIKALHGLL